MQDDGAIDRSELLAHFEWVRDLARRLVADESRADDLSQEVFGKALDHPPRSGTNLRGWLTIAARRFAWRQKRSDERRSFHERRIPRSGFAPSADDLVERALRQRLVVDVVLDLPPQERTAILLRYFEQCSLDEIAQITGAPEESVRTRIKRGLERARGALERERGPDWRALLAPIATPSLVHAAPVAAATAFGVIAMSSALKSILVSAALLLCASTFWILRDERDGTEIAKMNDTGLVSSGATSAARRTELTSSEVVDAEVFTQEGIAVSTIISSESRKAAKGTLRVRVVDADGRPVEGASVTATQVKTDGRRDVGFMRFPRRESNVRQSTTATDSEGRLIVSDLPLDLAFEVSALSPEKGRGSIGGVAIGSGGTAEVEIVIPPHCFVSGKLTNRRGDAIPGRVSGGLHDMDGTLIDLIVSSGAPTTEYRIGPIRATSIRLVASAAGHLEAFKTIDFDGTPEIVCDLRLDPMPIARGRIVDSKGEPLDIEAICAEVSSWWPDKRSVVEARPSDFDPRTNPNYIFPPDQECSNAVDVATGTFSITHRPVETWSGIWLGPWLIGAASIPEDGSEFDVPVDLRHVPRPNALRLTVSIVDAQSGEALEESQVSLARSLHETVDNSPIPIPMTKLAPGRFETTLHDGGTFFIRAGGRGRESRSTQVIVDRSDVHVRMALKRAESSVRGRVCDDEGRGIPDVRVVPLTLDGNVIASEFPSRSITTDEDGRFELDGLASGPMRLVADGGPLGSGENSIDLGSGTNQASITIGSCVLVDIRPANCSGPYSVVARNADGVPLVDFARYGGKAFGGISLRLPRGVYMIEIHVPHFRTLILPCTVVDRLELRPTLELQSP